MRQDQDTCIVGLRLRNSSKVTFCNAGANQLDAGTWVIVDAGEGEEAGQVIVAPRHMDASRLPEKLATFIRVPEEALYFPGEARTRSLSETPQGARLIGGIGFVDPARPGRSLEDERFRRRKSHMPALGRRVVIGNDRATIVSCDVSTSMVTIQYDDTDRVESLAIAALPDFDDFHEED